MMPPTEPAAHAELATGEDVRGHYIPAHVQDAVAAAKQQEHLEGDAAGAAGLQPDADDVERAAQAEPADLESQVYGPVGEEGAEGQFHCNCRRFSDMWRCCLGFLCPWFVVGSNLRRAGVHKKARSGCLLYMLLCTLLLCTLLFLAINRMGKIVGVDDCLQDDTVEMGSGSSDSSDPQPPLLPEHCDALLTRAILWYMENMTLVSLATGMALTGLVVGYWWRIRKVLGSTGSSLRSFLLMCCPLPYRYSLSIPEEQLEGLFHTRVGGGAYGEVFLACWNMSDVAVKRLTVHRCEGDELETQTTQFQNEVQLLARARHPNVVQLMGHVIADGWLGIVTEYCQRGSLDKVLRQGINLPWGLRLKMARDAAAGCFSLHRQGIVHCDLKSANLLVSKCGAVKVADFGLAQLRQHFRFDRDNGLVGTVQWAAPELLLGGPPGPEVHRESADVYSFGVVLWELATRKIPWSGRRDVEVMVGVGANGWRLEDPAEVLPAMLAKEIPEGFVELMYHWCAHCLVLLAEQVVCAALTNGDVRNSLAPAPQDRPTFSGVCKRLKRMHDAFRRAQPASVDPGSRCPQPAPQPAPAPTPRDIVATMPRMPGLPRRGGHDVADDDFCHVAKIARQSPGFGTWLRHLAPQDAVAAQMSIEAAGLDAAAELIEATGISGPPKCGARGRP